MTTLMYEAIIKSQQCFFKSGKSLNLDFRKQQLIKLKSAIKANEKAIMDALAIDLGKSEFESYATEIGIVYDEISLHLKKMSAWAKKKKVSTPLAAIPATSYTIAEPYGVTLIIAPWNYPFQLVIAPLVAAISTGNCAVIKPSELSQATSKILEKIISETFEPNYIKVLNGDANVSQALLQQKFDFIFFTGSPKIGKIVMKAAAENLTPLVLELGGKSPCIVDKDVNVKQVAKRIIWGKLLNAGQTCIAPDYLFVHTSIKDVLIKHMKGAIIELYGKDPKQSPDYPRIINKSTLIRLQSLLNTVTIIEGGISDIDTLYFSPTLVDHPSPDSALMQEEIFGPILPILSFENSEEIIEFISGKDKPLALYLFSKSTSFQNSILSRISAGGVTINDTIMHFTNAGLPFGGIGTSGMGSYHGESGFRAFSHTKSVMKRATWIDIPLRYPPFKSKLNLIRLILK